VIVVGDPRSLRNAAVFFLTMCVLFGGAMYFMARGCESMGPGGMDMPRSK
jgi:hypothetical protein